MKKLYRIICVFFILTFLDKEVVSQNCSTQFESADHELSNRKYSNQTQNYYNGERSVRDFALNIVLFQYQDGPISELYTIMQTVDSLNLIFSPVNFHFSVCGIHVVPYPYNLDPMQVGLESFSGPVQNFVANNYFNPNMINVVFARGVTPNAFFPNSTYPFPRIVLNNSGGYLVTPHEFGHFFGLRHTHQFDFMYNPNIITDELVNGSNCNTTGDLICDTPADPGLFAFRYLPYPDCIYIDSVTVDANGDLFNPLINNYMSMLNLCTNSFTPQQYERMAYYADHDWANLKSGGKNFNLNPIPMKVCIADGPITLSASDTGIVFSGNGVINNVFYPNLTGTGNQIINFTLSGQTNIDENTDVCFVYHDTSYSTNHVWQSFTIETSGQLTGVSLGIESLGSISGNYIFYQGNGTNGQILSQGTIELNGAEGWNWHRVSFNNLFVSAGEIYTIEFNFNNNVNIEGSSFNAYNAGNNNINGDAIFLTHLIPDLPFCGNTFSFPIFVNDGDSIIPHSIVPQNLCSSSNPILLQAFPYNSQYSIDNEPAIILNPSQIGEGNHIINLSYTNLYGCQSLISSTFTVSPQADIDLIDGSVFCENDSGITILPNFPNADIYLNGNLMNGSFINFDSLGLGQHTIGFAEPGNYEVIELDQLHFPPSSGNTSWGISGNGFIYQTFTPQKSGFLEKVIFALRINNQPHPFNVIVRKGLPIQGSGMNIIYSMPANVGGFNLDFHQFQFPMNTVPVFADSLYSFELHYSGLQAGQVYGSFGNTYPGGTNGYQNADFWFKTYVRIPNYFCDADSVLKIFEIVPSLNVNLGNDTVLVSGDSITLDAGNPGNQYLWSTGQTTQNITLTAPIDESNVWVLVSGTSGCSATDTIEINLITSAFETIATPILNVYPNPGNDFITLESSRLINEYQIVNLIGQTVERKTIVGNDKITVHTKQYPSGTYFIRILTEDGEANKRWIKN